MRVEIVEDASPIKQWYLLNRVCRIICGQRGTIECSRCKVEQLRQELIEMHDEELREFGV